MKKFLTLITLFVSITIYAQVGIGSLDPKATLDMVASNQTTPQNTDGLLIPRIDAFPIANPTADQNSMLVYLTTTVGTNTQGFYYWDNATAAWLPIGGVVATQGWEESGNAGTVSGTNFIGTTDTQALDIRTNNLIRARFNTTGQLGVGSLDPKATIDMVASNQATPQNTDGLLIPRVDAFPTANPTADQNSMLVYLTTTVGTNTPGFYYWDNATTAWLSIGGVVATQGWEESGNAGTVSGTNFIGTTDNQALDIRTNNVIRARFNTTGQLGVGSLDPKATIDLVASNQATPQNTDGLLIPRVDAFPTANPTADQNAMLVYLTTTVGVDTPGFYYWDNATTKWLSIRGIAQGWETTGNSGTISGTNFIGTADTQALDIRTDNVIRARFNTTGQLEILNAGGSVAIGENTGQGDDLADRANVFIGKNVAPSLGTGTVNTFNVNGNVGIGNEPLNNMIIGWNNIAIGKSALKNADNSIQNVAIGAFAAENTTSINGLVAVGYKAAEAIHGDDNTAIGYFALGGDDTVVGTAQSNTVIGNFAGTSNAFGDENVFIGKQSDALNKSGNQNTILGTNAGINFLSGATANDLDGRVLIGYESGSRDFTNNKLYIENSSTTTPLIGGDFANDRVGINTDVSTLTHSFTVTGTAKITQLVNITPGTAPATPAEGDVYYDSALKKLRVYTGAAWENLN